MAVKPTMLFRYADRLMLVAHVAEPPRDQDWTAYCDQLHSVREQLCATVVYTLGGGPNSKQREQMRSAAGDLPKVLVSVMTGSALVRGIITSLNWFVRDQHRAFALGDFEGAFAHVARTGGGWQRERVRQDLAALARELGVSMMTRASQAT